MKTVHQNLVSIVNKAGALILSLRDVVFEEASNAYRGYVDLSHMPPELGALLLELEELVELQSFGQVDEIQGKIDAFDLAAILQDGSELRIKDLYVSSSGAASFRKQAPLCIRK